MATNLSDLHEMVKNFLQTPEGKAEMKRQNVSLGYSDAEALMAAKKLKEAISAAFIAEQKQPNPHFDDKGVTVKLSKRKADDGFVILISYSAKSLYRSSMLLWEGTGDYSKNSWNFRDAPTGSSNVFTGEGIYDIFALFTSGYNTTKSARGAWYDDEAGGEKFGEPMRSPLHYPSHDFITRTIRQFEQAYPGITVKYPDEWK